MKGLFIEWAKISENPIAVYTIKRQDYEVDGILYPSLYRLYMETEDVTEARFVEGYLYDWDQWNSIASSSYYRDEIARWRTELKAKVLGRLVDELIKDATSGSKSSKSSAKFLVEKLSKQDKGRPTTAAVATTEEKTSTIVGEIARDVKRLRLQ